MFKKFKNTKTPPPAAPTSEEILSDMETFEIDLPVQRLQKLDASATVKNVEDWWLLFEQFELNLKDLTLIHNELKTCHSKLKDCKKELESESHQIKKNIQKQQTDIKKVLT